MKKIINALVFLGAGWMLRSMFDAAPQEAEAAGGGGGGVEKCAAKNGDVNASGAVDLSDAVTILGNLFLGNPTELPPLCASSAAQGLPDTGQTQCYDCSGQSTECFDCTGRPRPCGGFMESFLALQDSIQRTGCPNDVNRFTLNGDDTVTDNCTGLQWERFTDRDGDGLAEPFTWCDALDFCQNLSFAGHDDWRLPNVRELESLIDYGKFNPAADPVFRFTTDQFTQYWTSTTTIRDPDLSYFIDFTIADVTRTEKFTGLSVRAVRGGQ